MYTPYNVTDNVTCRVKISTACHKEYVTRTCQCNITWPWMDLMWKWNVFTGPTQGNMLKTDSEITFVHIICRSRPKTDIANLAVTIHLLYCLPQCLLYNKNAVWCIKSSKEMEFRLTCLIELWLTQLSNYRRDVWFQFSFFFSFS